MKTSSIQELARLDIESSFILSDAHYHIKVADTEVPKRRVGRLVITGTAQETF
jgi:hypothetical protein